MLMEEIKQCFHLNFKHISMTQKLQDGTNHNLACAVTRVVVLNTTKLQAFVCRS